MEHTTNLNLKKPEYWELADISDINDNMDTLDTVVADKVDKVTGKALSTNDYTTAEKSKLAGIETGANKYTHPANHPPSIITQDASNRFVTDVEKATWNAKETPADAQTKADTAENNAKAYTDTHDENTVKHITSTERTNWNDANSKKHTHSNKSVLDTVTQSLVDIWNTVTGKADKSYVDTELGKKANSVHGHTLDSVLDSGSSTDKAMKVGRYLQSATGVPTSNLGSPTVTEMALFDSQFDNKTWFYPASMFAFEYTNDGMNWINANISESQIKAFVSGCVSASIVIPNGCQQYRIRIDNKNSYVFINALYMYFSTSGNRTSIKIRKKRDDGDWVQHTDSDQVVSSWPGHLYMPFSTIAWSRASTNGHYRYVEILFTPSWDHVTNDITLYRFELWGGYPVGSRSIFSWDGDKNVTFPAKVKAEQTSASDADNTLATKKYVDDKVKTDVPTNAKFTDTVTTINGKTGAITKADITALGIPAQDTIYTHPGTGTNPHGTTKTDIGLTNVTNDKQATKTEFDSHNTDTTKHITEAERTAWNAKSTLLLGESTSTAYRGDRGKIAYDHSQIAHAPSDAQKNSAITKPEIEAKLTGVITTHTHTVTKADVGLANVDNVKQMPLSGGTATGPIVAQNNTAYTTPQVRNIRLIAEGGTVPSLANGEIALIYSTAVMP